MVYIKMKDFRQTHRLFQSELAELLGTTQSVISRMELKGVSELQAPHYKILCEKFGKEDVDGFCSETKPAIVSQRNVNAGAGQQSNIINDNQLSLDIIQKQAEAMAKALTKQSEQTDRLLALLEKITDKS